MMRWFGESWGADVCEPDTHIDTPVGEPCAWCNEPIIDGDAGLSVPYASADGPSVLHYHYACWMRTITGSVGHQDATCHCFGGTGDGDPAGRTRRQAAQDAWDKFSGRLRWPTPDPTCGPLRETAR